MWWYAPFSCVVSPLAERSTPVHFRPKRPVPHLIRVSNLIADTVSEGVSSYRRSTIIRFLPERPISRLIRGKSWSRGAPVVFDRNSLFPPRKGLKTCGRHRSGIGVARGEMSNPLPYRPKRPVPCRGWDFKAGQSGSVFYQNRQSLPALGLKTGYPRLYVYASNDLFPASPGLEQGLGLVYQRCPPLISLSSRERLREKRP